MLRRDAAYAFSWSQEPPALSAVMDLDKEWRSRNSRAELTLGILLPRSAGDDALDRVRPGQNSKSRDPSALVRGIYIISKGHLAEGNICEAQATFCDFMTLMLPGEWVKAHVRTTVDGRRGSTSWRGQEQDLGCGSDQCFPYRVNRGVEARAKIQSTVASTCRR